MWLHVLHSDAGGRLRGRPMLAARMYGRLPGSKPSSRVVSTTHGFTGLAAILLSVPIAQFNGFHAPGF